MLGSLRLVLALGVASSHAGVTVLGYNPGVVSVVVFYLISGFVTANLLDRQLRTALAYYWERSLRLFPPYWGALCVAIAVWALFEPRDVYFLQRAPDWRDWAANVVIIPLNFYMWTGQDHFTLIPPAWSLGAELQFYVLAPWLLLLIPRARLPVAAASLLLWLTAQAGIVNADWWGYRLLPGILFVFLAGASVFRRETQLVAAVWAIAALVLLALILGILPPRPFNIETSAGLVLGIPALAILARLPRRDWDDAVGRLAYPVFLLHFPTAWVMQAWGHSAADLLARPELMAIWLAGTLAAGWLLYGLTEAPLTRLRHSLRRTGAARRDGASLTPSTEPAAHAVTKLRD